MARIQIQYWDEANGAPAVIDPNAHEPDVRGLYIQDDTSDDENVLVSRDSSGNMTFKDVVQSTAKTLTDLVAGTGGLTPDGHKVLRQLIHFIDDGPAEGFASGAYREVTGTVFPTAVIWYTDSSKTDKIVEKLITWTGVNATTIVWKIYDTDGSTVLATVTDTVAYSGVFETSRTRAIA